MRIGIIGIGNVGGTLGRSWAARGHEVIFGVRDPRAPHVTALLEEIGPAARATNIEEAVAAASTVVLAVPWEAAPDVIAAAGDLSGKILVDTTNPIAPGFELALGHDTSAAEEIARCADGARVVKAFNTLGAEHLADPIFGDEVLTMFLCGDDPEARDTVAELARELGFEVVDAGPLKNARLIEPLAMLWIRLALVEGAGRDIAFKLIRR
ncbi:MAG: NADPH-dependent F420 reductase [Gemmatimonadetes bacterium]|uniref:NADPH-dependent F420 reductase n=1 Tax=Candidatus Kutchimonas denitrificans TaxID=3056748 RepID=A0AAE4ZAL6_9BACT|nr:NADPH-dependent F420 reductase [Gemmatimonadota bacterium]NIR74591.1 NADPH-dependent F420 reductase [Candidatus Kutchimonas denitrificans]NIS02781.1 NADPH-dependent F420 reductase [Gemmatimonadota bacterium]NIT68942.1 NADPH-dependent F420 reductase [Gemmatimonadota bacterium]NIU52247.1 NAD(P)-binding domain-containing protein [Gemmatimonadota bacterium]